MCVVPSVTDICQKEKSNEKYSVPTFSKGFQKTDFNSKLDMVIFKTEFFSRYSSTFILWLFRTGKLMKVIVFVPALIYGAVVNCFFLAMLTNLAKRLFLDDV